MPGESRPRLPGSRGVYRGPDAFVAQAESQFARVLAQSGGVSVPGSGGGSGNETSEILEGGEWVLMDNGFTSSGVLVANLMRFLPCKIQKQDFRLNVSRTSITTNLAGGTLRSAIYLYSRTTDTLTKLGASEHVIPTDSIGIKTTTLNGTLVLSAGVQYFQCFWVSSATPAFVLRNPSSSASGFIAHYSYAVSSFPASGFQDMFGRGGLTRVTNPNVNVPDIAYFSNRTILYL